VESALDHGNMKLNLPTLAELDEPLVSNPETSKSPFDQQIEAAFQFYNEVKISELNERATNTIVEMETKREILEWYINEQKISE
jgi:hypothetical protein